MGQAGSHAPPPQQRGRRVNTLPHDPPRLAPKVPLAKPPLHAPKVLPPLCESPRLRSTDNGAILHSGGTISGRRPTAPHESVPHGHVHANVYRSRSAGNSGEGDIRTRERDPLHRSHTNLDLRHEGGSINKRFGSEPDLRVEEEQKTKNGNKHFRKKYRAPPPPTHNDQNVEGSSPDSSDVNGRLEPQRKLRLFRTRNETKKLNGHDNGNINYRNSYHDYKSLDDNQAFERRYRSPYKDKEQHFKYPDTQDMTQSSVSLKREEKLLQHQQEFRKARIDRISGCRAKTSRNEHNEAWKTPLLNRNFRYSERFTRDGSESPKVPVLRREKTFDETLMSSERDSDSSKAIHEKKLRSSEHLKGSKPTPLAESSKPLRKSLPSLLVKNNEEKDEFQAELKKATSKIRNQLGNRINDSETKTSQVKANEEKPPTKVPSKVIKSSLTSVKQEMKANAPRRPLSRANDDKARQTNNAKIQDNKYKASSKENSRPMPDRGQASGKESTPEHSPTRNNESLMSQAPKEKQKQKAPSKQFYFGMIESKQTEPKDRLKDFPGLGSPIIEEISNFHLIEKKLLNYTEDDEFDKFNAKMKADCKIKNISSESALSSDGSEGSCSEGSLGIALRLRPTLPKKQRAVPRFSPAAAWRQLACLDDHLAAETQPLAVETKISGEISAESSPRSDQSADKSGDSGISGDHAHSDQRIDSPSRQHVVEAVGLAWTPQQDLGDSSSESGPAPALLHAPPVATYSPAGQPFSLSLPRESQERGKQLQQGFNSLQKLKKSVSGAFGALGSRRFDIEHEPMLQEQEQNWFLTKSAPNSLSNPLMFQQPRAKDGDVIKEESSQTSGKGEESGGWRLGNSYMSWGGHVMYLPPTPLAEQPLSILGPIERPVRSKSSGCLEASARAARASLAREMRERSASPPARALPARVLPATHRSSNIAAARGKRFTFQSTVRQLERRRIAEKLSKEADLKEQQRKTELEAMRRVEEEFQRKRAREKANIRQQLRLVSGAASMPTHISNPNKTRDSPDGSCRESPAPERTRQRHSNASSEISGRSKSTTPIRSVELSEWRVSECARVYRDWAPAREHPPATARMPSAIGVETEAFSGSPVSDNYRMEFARGRSPRTPRAPRLAPRAPSSSGSDLSLRQPIQISEPTKEEPEEAAIVPTLRPAPARLPAALLTH